MVIGITHPNHVQPATVQPAMSAGTTTATRHVTVEGSSVVDVTVVGNSIGGWIAAEMAVLGSNRVSSYVLVDAVGLEVPGYPVVDFFSLTPAEVAQRSYYDPATFGVDPAKLPPGAQAAMGGDPDFGRAYAAAIPGGQFRLIERAGHMPQLETPDALLDVAWSFADGHATGKPARRSRLASAALRRRSGR